MQPGAGCRIGSRRRRAGHRRQRRTSCPMVRALRGHAIARRSAETRAAARDDCGCDQGGIEERMMLPTQVLDSEFKPHPTEVITTRRSVVPDCTVLEHFQPFREFLAALCRFRCLARRDVAQHGHLLSEKVFVIALEIGAKNIALFFRRIRYLGSSPGRKSWRARRRVRGSPPNRFV